MDSLKKFKILNPTEASENIDKILDINENLEYIDKLIIKEYTKTSLHGDLNKWLMNLAMDYNYYEAVAYFTGRLMYSLNSYAQKKTKFFTQNDNTIYGVIKIPYSCLLLYKRAKGNIILLTSFTSTSLSKERALAFSGRKNSKEIYKTNLLFSVLFIIKNKWKENWISNGIDIHDISCYQNEKEI